ncbi:MAG: hypothetical protein QXL16_00565 [Candidatus Micrarchaeaceae archaeon]
MEYMATKSSEKQSGTSIGAFLLEIIGSLLYLFAFSTLGTGGYANSSWSGSIAALWAPLLVALALVSSIGLFIASFGELVWHNSKELRNAAYKASLLGGFSLFALTYLGGVSGFSFFVVVVGFFLSIIGSRMVM